jgi:uncharacterized RDD family membrane protein YckC
VSWDTVLVQFVVPREPGIASLPRRVAVGACDGLLMLTILGMTAGAVFAVLSRLGRRPGWFDGVGPDPTTLQRWNLPLTVASVGLSTIGANWRSPGMRVFGIRRVDAGTGGPVNAYSACVESAVSAVITQVEKRLRRPEAEAYEARRVAANEELARMREANPEADPSELLRRSQEILHQQRVGCGPLASRGAVWVMVQHLPALRSHRRQTLSQRLAGTVVVRER